MRRCGQLASVFVLTLSSLRASAYSVQTHEQLVDLAWKPSIVPLLLSRYPGLSQAQLDEAHAYAYGGCAIQDVGYYPFGSQFFSDLTHYVRSGNFVQALLRNAKTIDELAFAIGALTHYIGDSTGHSLATNPSVSQQFPKLEAKYGPLVTYEQNPHAHVRTEFAFDINEISKHRFAPSRYLVHVGLKVATDLLGRAFFETYGLRLESVLGVRRQSSNIRGYRFAVRSLLPRIAYAENVLHKHRMPPDVQDEELAKLTRALAQSDFENGWDQYRRTPGIGTYTLAGLIYILPKVGPLALLAVKGPDEKAEQAYVKSVNVTIARICKVLGDVQNDDKTLSRDLPNRDLDTGDKVRPGGYRLADETYEKLLSTLVKQKVGRIPAGLKSDIAEFYADPTAPITTRKNPAKWAVLQADLTEVEAKETIPVP